NGMNFGSNFDFVHAESIRTVDPFFVAAVHTYENSPLGISSQRRGERGTYPALVRVPSQHRIHIDGFVSDVGEIRVNRPVRQSAKPHERIRAMTFRCSQSHVEAVAGAGSRRQFQTMTREDTHR